MVGGLDLVDVKVEKELAGLDLVALFNLGIEAVAVHGHGVDTDVDEELHAGGAGEADGVFGIRDRADLAVEGSHDIARSGLDADAIAQDAAGKGIIRNVLAGDDGAGCGRLDLTCGAADDGVFRDLDLLCGFRGGFLFLFFLPEDPCAGEGDGARDQQDDGVLDRIVDGEITGDAGHAVSGRAEAHEGCQQSADGTADTAGDEGLEEAHVDTEDRGLRDAERGGHGGRDSDGFGLLVSDLEADRKAGAELGEVGGGGDGHPGVQAGLGEHAGLNDVVHVVQAHDDGPGIDRAHDTGADGVADQDLGTCQNVCLQGGEDRSDDPEGQESSHKDGAKRGDEEVDHLRHMLMQPLFDHAHEPDGDNDRYDVALIAGPLNGDDIADQVPARYCRCSNLAPVPCKQIRVHILYRNIKKLMDLLGIRDVPAVQEGRMDHQQAGDRTQEEVAAEDARRGDGDDDGQISKCRVGDSIQEGKPVAFAEAQSGDLGEGLDQTHHETGCDDGGQDRDEDVADGLEGLAPDRSLGRCRRLDVVLGAGGDAGDLNELVKDLVDGTCTDDQLELSVGLEHALDAIDFLECLFVDLAVIRDNKTKSGRAVRGGYYVRAAADIIGDLLRTFVIIQSHTGFLPLLEHILPGECPPPRSGSGHFSSDGPTGYVIKIMVHEQLQK